MGVLHPPYVAAFGSGASRSDPRRRALGALVAVATLAMGARAARAELADGIEEARHVPREYHGGVDGRSAPAPSTGGEAERASASTSEWTAWWEGGRLTGSWAGLRGQLEDAGLAFEGSWTVDLSSVLGGGLRRRGVQRSLVDVAARVDLSRVVGWAGAALYADYQVLTGANGSDDAGDIQGFSSIDGRDLAQLSELWFEQRLFDDRMRIKLGKVDANTEFAFAENAGGFVSSSMGMSPTILLPTYPDPATSVNVFVAPSEPTYAGIGVYDGAAVRGVHTGSRGPATFFDDFAELFTVGEVGARWGDALAGRLGIGGWYQDGAFDVDDGAGTTHRRGTAGAYLVLDQSLWRANESSDDERGLAGFVMWGWTEPAVAEIEHHLGGGVAWRGPFAARAADELGVGASWVGAGDALDPAIRRTHELTIEIYYAAAVSGWLVVEPDLQWISSPLGAADADDAWVGSLRLTLTL